VPVLSEVVGVLERLYDPETAEPWDAVGLVCGDPDADVRRIQFAVDPVESTVSEALDSGADLLVVHHPLLLRPVHGVAATTAKGRLVHRLITGGCALYVAHTNADKAMPGVSDALAEAVGLPVDRLRTLSDHGIGRVGELPEAVRLRDFVSVVSTSLRAGAGGVRAAGDPERIVRRVAVAGGAGDDLFDAVRSSGADVYVTSDLRHHPASEAMEAGGPALVDVGHFASEWPWLRDARARLLAELPPDSVEAVVSVINTDPWSFHEGGTR
jgi:dinuclear metal center YbgI/SA1388 family protein